VVTGAAPYTVPLLAALALLGPGCRVREQSEGPYAFTATAVERDDCGLVPASGALPSGDFFTTGNYVRIQYEWYGMTLAGAYRSRSLFDAAPESFYADGSAQNVTADVGDLPCALDVATVHLDGTTDSAASLHGTLRFRYEARQPPGCLCESWVSFQAMHR
jgi:hypothetical protein